MRECSYLCGRQIFLKQNTGQKNTFITWIQDRTYIQNIQRMPENYYKNCRQKKLANNLNIAFKNNNKKKEDIQKVNKHKKRSSTWVIRLTNEDSNVVPLLMKLNVKILKDSNNECCWPTWRTQIYKITLIVKV